MVERATVTKTSNGSVRVGDASFSSYLRPDEPRSFLQQHHTVAAAHVRCSTIDDSTTELSIFDAHKYFNELGGSDNQKGIISSTSRVSPISNVSADRSPEQSDIASLQHRHSSASSAVDGYAGIRSYRARSFHAATPTASSEASWNSQTGLLSHPPGAIAVSMRNPLHTAHSKKKSRPLISTSRWIFRRKCPCSGKKSVEVKENASEHISPKPLTPPPPLQSRLSSHNQISESAVHLKKQEPHTNPSTSVEKLTLNMEKATFKPTQTSNSHGILITPHNWVDQKQPDESVPMIMSDYRKPSPDESTFPSTAVPPQRVIATGRSFVDHATGFTFPILNQPSKFSPPTRLKSVDEDPPRDSLEVFRPADVDSNFAPRKSITRDRQNFIFPASPKSRIIDDDVASDASSDLFEIESFSTQSTSTYPIIYKHRDSLDEASNFDPTRRSGADATPSSTAFLYGRRSLDESSAITPTINECYEPSEASIEWSVTTAEGFDRASITNYSVTASEIADHHELMNTKEYQQQAEKSKRRNSSGNGLLSCRCEKAVSVGPRPVKCVSAAGGHKGITHLPMNLKPHVSSRPVTENKPPLARSHSARLSIAFAT